MHHQDDQPPLELASIAARNALDLLGNIRRHPIAENSPARRSRLCATVQA
jgi:hypothetical protein